MKISPNLAICALLPMLLCFPALGQAHGGGTDAQGCHRDSTTGERHCHEKSDATDEYWRDIVAEPRLIDADTLDLSGTRIRLHGIDAPELNEGCDGHGTTVLCGQSALFALAGRLDGKTITCVRYGMDRYSRIVAKCYEAGEDISEWLVLQGWARAYREYSEDYLPMEREARERGVGIWAGEYAVP